MIRTRQFIDRIFEARRRKNPPVKPPPPFFNPKEMDDFVLTTLGWGDYIKMLHYLDKYDLYSNGGVTRTSHHYVHENTIDFEWEVENYGQDIPPAENDEIDTLANKIQETVQEEVKDISQKIYRALGREWDYQHSAECVDENIRINEYEFDEEGERTGAGEFTIDTLPDEAAKERARDWFRSSIGDDDFWSEHILDEWKNELEEMGFDSPDIAYSGFSSQGDGASFTSKHFDFEKWAAWFMSGKDKDRGHPYTDELFKDEPPPVAEAVPPPQQEAEENPMLKELGDVAMMGSVDLSSVMQELPVNYMSGAQQYHWKRNTPDFGVRISCDVLIFSLQLPDQSWDVSVRIGDNQNRTYVLSRAIADHDEKVNFRLNVSKLIPVLDDLADRTWADNVDQLKREIEIVFNRIFTPPGKGRVISSFFEY